MKREDLKVGAVMTFDDAHRFLLDKLDAADADNMIRFIRGQEVKNKELDELCQGYAKALDDSIDNTNRALALTNNGWISVDERLPDFVEWYLIYDGRRNVSTIAFFDRHFEDGSPIWLVNGDVGRNGYESEWENVTHWQPLPPPPEQAKGASHE